VHICLDATSAVVSAPVPPERLIQILRCAERVVPGDGTGGAWLPWVQIPEHPATHPNHIRPPVTRWREAVDFGYQVWGMAWLIFSGTFLAYGVYYTSLLLYSVAKVSAAIYFRPMSR
jgi:hypothetical protein|tara:strand:+ start:912 stop:1262 length:351 start_codon:yes stop_codon:yes gene_type:complete